MSCPYPYLRGCSAFYSISRPGKYKLHVKLNDIHHVAGSPFDVEVSVVASLCASWCMGLTGLLHIYVYIYMHSPLLCVKIVRLRTLYCSLIVSYNDYFFQILPSYTVAGLCTGTGSCLATILPDEKSGILLITSAQFFCQFFSQTLIYILYTNTH